MNKLWFLIILLMAGCENGQLVLSEEDRARVKSNYLIMAEKRHLLFVECMKLSANIKRDSDDDVSDIIDECGTEAVYMSNQYARGL